MSNTERIATIVAAIVAREGAEWGAAIGRVATDLGISTAAVAHCVAATARALRDPYLESLS